MLQVPGVTLPMAVALGEREIRTVEDLADLATDEVRGGFEVKNGERVRVPGALESFNLSQEDAEMLILQARVAAGWIDASELPQPEPEPEFEEGYGEDYLSEAEQLFDTGAAATEEAADGEADADADGADDASSER